MTPLLRLVGQIDPTHTAELAAQHSTSGTVYLLVILCFALVAAVLVLWRADQGKASKAAADKDRELDAAKTQLREAAGREAAAAGAHAAESARLREDLLNRLLHAAAAAEARVDRVRDEAAAEVSRHAEMAADTIRGSENIARLLQGCIDALGRIAGRPS